MHLTEVCDAEQPHVITNVQATEADTPDVAVTAPIQSALAERALLPSEQVVDSGYVDAALLVESHTTYGIDLIGPVHANTSWQAQGDSCSETAHFALDWERKLATYPQGKTSVQWMPVRNSGGRAMISIGFAPEDCPACSVRARCTRARIGPLCGQIKDPPASDCYCRRAQRGAAGGLAGRPALRQDAPLALCPSDSGKLARQSEGGFANTIMSPPRILPRECCLKARSCQ